MDQKHEKLQNILRELAAEFYSRESNRQSLMTVTHVHMSESGTHATIFFTVLPEDKETSALEFAHRQLTDFKEYVRKNSRVGRIPFFEVRIDTGEKNRQRMDELGKTL